MSNTKEKYLILSKDIQESAVSKNVLYNTAIIMYLYYEDTLQNYFYYIQNIPKEISLYVYSSKEEVCEKVKEFLTDIDKKNAYVSLKENRGRDVSALLVAAKEVTSKYEYICFIHDKKANAEELKEDTKEWIELLWENSLASSTYIINILAKLSETEKIGLLVPPKPLGKRNRAGMVNCWYKNHDKVLELARLLQLKCDIDFNVPPIAIGTVFWAKTKALKKLFDYDWKYGDFPNEPMPLDGTISHAIERILSYVAEDIGYETMVSITVYQAERRIEKFQGIANKAFHVLESEIGIRNLNSLEFFTNDKKAIIDFMKRWENVYLYGAGIVGKCCLKTLGILGYVPKGFLVTQKNEVEFVENIPVYTLDDIYNKNNIGIIVSVGFENRKDIIKYLEEKQVKEYMVWE